MNEINFERQSEMILNNEKTKVCRFPYYFVIVTNLSDGIAHVSRYCNLESRIGSVDVLTLKPGESGYISTEHGVTDGFFALGNGKIQIIPSND